jgi:hypothetical protein
MGRAVLLFAGVAANNREKYIYAGKETFLGEE